MKGTKTLQPIHPFPARMAPEIAFDAIGRLRKGASILDPMMGSGTSLKVAAGYNFNCAGFDLDPLAVLIARTWNSTIDVDVFQVAGERVLEIAQDSGSSSLSWLDSETNDFIDFWFANPQKSDLAKLSVSILTEKNSEVSDALKVALSRCIITKERGASLARDISHAKPHKVRDTNDYNVMAEFRKSVKIVADRLKNNTSKSKIITKQGDARSLSLVEDLSMDYIITSPPYLHAVDYFRGHRLSLVWMGYTLEEIRKMRSQSVGIEKKPDEVPDAILQTALLKNAGEFHKLSATKLQHLSRYAIDLYLICAEFQRVLKQKGKATIVIADAWSSGVLVRNTQLFKNAANLAGLKLRSEHERQIPANRRYLPPPEYLTNTDLDKRMKTEAILTFAKP